MLAEGGAMGKRGGGVGGPRPGQQSKITGFLRKTEAKLAEGSPGKVEGDRPRSPLDNMTNRREPVIASPDVKEVKSLQEIGKNIIKEEFMQHRIFGILLDYSKKL